MSFAPSQTSAGGREISMEELLKLYPGPTATVVMTKPVNLTLEGFRRVKIPVGVNEIPVKILEDEHLAFYLQAHGAKPHVQAKGLPDEDEDGGVPTIDDLNKLSKAQLVDKAKAEYDLELDPAEKKDDLVLAIIEAAEKKSASR